jgi:hypothetical protein
MDCAVVARFARRALDGPARDPLTARKIVEWLYEQEDELELGLPLALKTVTKRPGKKTARTTSHDFAKAYKANRPSVLAALEEAAAAPLGVDDPVMDNLRALATNLDLGEIELGILEVVARYTRSYLMEQLCDQLTRPMDRWSVAAWCGSTRTRTASLAPVATCTSPRQSTPI